MPWLLPEFAALHANAALGTLDWREDLTLEKLPRFIDMLHPRLLLAHGGRNAVEKRRSCVTACVHCCPRQRRALSG